MKGYLRATIAMLLTIATGVGIWHFAGSGGVSQEKVRTSNGGGSCRIDTAPGSAETPGALPPTTEPQVEVKSNDACYVCHMPFLQEKLAAAHAKAKVWCGTCHGPSVAHTENEYIGATLPDVVYAKAEIDGMCRQCHDRKKHADLATKKRLAHLAEGQKAQEAIKGRPIEVAGVCTDCHGRHWIKPREQ